MYPRRTGGKHFRLDHVTQNALAARNNEAWKLGKGLLRTWSCVGERKGLVMYFGQEFYSKPTTLIELDSLQSILLQISDCWQITKPLLDFTLKSKWRAPQVVACENIHFSSLFAAWDVSLGGSSATQRQKFYADDVKSVWKPVRSADWLTE